MLDNADIESVLSGLTPQFRRPLCGQAVAHPSRSLLTCFSILIASVFWLGTQAELVWTLPVGLWAVTLVISQWLDVEVDTLYSFTLDSMLVAIVALQLPSGSASIIVMVGVALRLVSRATEDSWSSLLSLATLTATEGVIAIVVAGLVHDFNPLLAAMAVIAAIRLSDRAFGCLVVWSGMGALDWRSLVPQVLADIAFDTVVALPLTALVVLADSSLSPVLVLPLMGAFAALSRSFMKRVNAERDLSDAKHEARTDQLTSVLNRRGLIDTCASLEGSFWVIAVDVDHFKLLNDTYGHHSGDHALREVASALRRAAGPDAIVARTGGEEFVVIRENGSLQLAEDLRGAVAESVPEFNVTASFGATQGEVGPEALDSTLNLADNALYAAKAAGRNCVFVWDAASGKATVSSIPGVDDQFRHAA